MIQLFIGLGWVRAAVEKLIDPQWWSGDTLGVFLTEHQASTVSWYQPFLDLIVGPNVVIISLVVFGLQFLAGALMLSGRQIPAALAIGSFLNLHFIAAGAVTPSVFYLLAQAAVAFWLLERSGADLNSGLRVGATAALAIALMSVVSISTLHPAEVIDDPGIMLVTAGLIGFGACEVLHRRANSDIGLP